MYIVIYRFEVIEGQEEQFKTVWAKLTQAYLDYSKSLGSRLHSDGDGDFIAYAQWPNKEIFAKAKDRLPEHAKELGTHMKALCTSISMLHNLEVELDLLERG